MKAIFALLTLLALTNALPDPVCSKATSLCSFFNQMLWYVHAADGMMARTTDLLGVLNFSACTNITTIDPMYIIYEYITFQWSFGTNWVMALTRYLTLIRDTLQAVDNWLMYCGYSIKNVLSALMAIINYISQNPVGYDMKVANNTAMNGIDAYHFLGIAYTTMYNTNGYLTGGYLGEAFYDIFMSSVPH